ncbi:MAG: adenylate/guanylate cyclase domain-containing protein [Leptonema sp. (in: Bacteria)]|nr:adenylate/guanylate cyclase domain-containing protein [Leptonema sp. (in: bacteria)]
MTTEQNPYQQVIQETMRQRIRSLFLAEQERSERLVVFIRFGIMALYAVGGLGVRKEIPEHSLNAILLAAATGTIISIVVYVLLKKGFFSDKLKYYTTTADIIIFLTTLWQFGTFRTFKSEAFLVLFLWIAIAAMRFSVKLTIYAGSIAAIGYIVLIVMALTKGTIHTGTVTDHFVSEKVSLGNLGLRVLFVSALFIVSAYIAKIYEGLILRAAEKEITAEREVQEKEKVKETFSRYVTQQVAEKILQEGVAMSGERRRATVLFCDIRNFTRMSEQMEPEDIVSFLKEYLTVMVSVIFDYGGTLDKFVGDEIMAVFGVPVTTGQDELNAVYAAMKMREELNKLNQRRQIKNLPPIRFGIGIHSGDVVAGNIGSDQRMEYTVIGQAVNLASRIEALNKHLSTDILITQDTFDAISNQVEVSKQPLVRVKGVERPVQTYLVNEIRKTA